MNYFVDAIKRYADFDGLATVKEYWMFVLFNSIFALILFLIGFLVTALLFLLGLYFLAVLIPALAILVRRLRDAGYEWTWIFISLIPIAGAIWLLILLCKPSVAQNTNAAE